MAAPKKYPNELREQSQRMVTKAMADEVSLSLNAGGLRIGPAVGVSPDTLRGWTRRFDMDH